MPPTQANYGWGLGTRLALKEDESVDLDTHDVY